jgi:hypothetical protein
MTDRERVDELLDRWESAAAAEPGLSPSEYLGRETGPHPPGVTAQFLYRAAALARVGRKLSALRPPTVAAVALVPGFEPVPGYRLDRPLGSGGFGQVWRAVGPGGVPAALKFVPLGRAVSAAEWRAVRLMKEVRHPHLIAVHAAWEAHGYLVVAMEPADGSLADRLRECVGRGLPGVPRDELLVLLGDAAAALDYLNEPRHPVEDGRVGGIQHRDVKPQNLLTLGGRVKVADFGLARALTGEVTGHTGGMTLDYAAPEFFDGWTSAHSDQYSLAVTYCHLRGGRLPFGGNPAEVTIGHLKRKPDLSMLPAAERPAVARALAKRPEDRWPSCSAFVAALRGTSEAAEPPAEIAPTRRRRAVRLGIGGLLVATAIALAVTVVRGRGPNLAPDATGGAATAANPIRPVEPDKTATGAIRPARRIEVGTHTAALAVSPDGRFAACGGPVPPGGSGIAVFDLRTGAAVERVFAGRDGIPGHTRPVRSVSFSPDGDHLVTADDGGLLVFWDAATGRLEAAKFGRLAVYAPDEPVVLASAGGALDLSLHRLDGAPMGLGAVPGPVAGLALSPGGGYALACSAKGEVSVWDRKRGEEVGRWTVPRGGLGRPAFKPDGRQVLLGHNLYAVPDGARVGGLDPPPAEVTAAALAPDGRRAAVATADGTVIVWDTDTGKEICRLADCRSEIHSVAFAPSSVRVVAVAADGGLYVWDVPTG